MSTFLLSIFVQCLGYQFGDINPDRTDFRAEATPQAGIQIGLIKVFTAWKESGKYQIPSHIVNVTKSLSQLSIDRTDKPTSAAADTAEDLIKS
jgi:hypothetical protein